jgi:hypothetical protein
VGDLVDKLVLENVAQDDADGENDELWLLLVEPEALTVGDTVVKVDAVGVKEPLLDTLKDPLDDTVEDNEDVPDTLWLPVALEEIDDVPQTVGDSEDEILALPHVEPEALAVGDIDGEDDIVDVVEPLLDTLKDPLDETVEDKDDDPDAL